MSYTTLSYYAPKFYLNVTPDGRLLPLMLMIAGREGDVDAATSAMSVKETIVAEKRKNEEFAFIQYRDDILIGEIEYADILKGHYLVRARPLPPAVFLVDEKRRREYLDYVKESLVSSLIQEGNAPTCDLLELGVVMTQWADWELNYSFFSPISYGAFLKIAQNKGDGAASGLVSEDGEG